MNFLAHIYLTGNNTCVTIGNFMADSIKGLQYKAFDKTFKKGFCYINKLIPERMPTLT